jgi:parvulin-like peptidyl-prolyl isomerase
MTSRKVKQIQAICLLMVCSLFGAIANAVETSAASASAEKPKEQPLDYIAIVGGEKIGIGEYVAALRRGMGKRFYHGKAPEAELKKFYKEVADEMIERVLKIQEAKRRGIKPEVAAVDKGVSDFDAKFRDDPEWQKERDTVLAQVREKLAGDSLAMKLEAQAKAVKEPDSSELKVYYDAHHDLFTTPEQARVSMIMLKVDPSSPSAVWEQAREEAAAIVGRLNKGTDFAELARIHSSDPSSQNGGDMGFIHTGMLGENAQQVLDIMEKGETSSPVVLLEGVAIFRLDDRTKPQLNAFETVKERAVLLLKREKSEQQWQALMSKLRKETKIEVNDAPWR